jgi:cysteine-rich repeat protein
MPGSRKTPSPLPFTLLLTLPLSCHPDPQEGQVSDPQGCRTIILPYNDDDTTTDTTTTATTTDATTDATTETSGTTDDTTTPPPICGDGTKDPGEECDDGNNQSSDGCSADCTRESYIVFITSLSYSGNLGGLAGADGICQAHAAETRLPGTYQAWLSTTSQSPSNRFGFPYSFTGRFVLPDSTVIAEDWSDLLDGTLLAPIDRNEDSALVVGPQHVWTHTIKTGHPVSGDPCNTWGSASNAFNAFVGSSASTTAGWTTTNTHSCNSSARLYCFQVAP